MCRAMPTTTPRALGAMLSGAALAGWLAGSTLNPPVAVTQVAPPRPAVAPVIRAELPRLTWPVALPRVAPPAPSRNPFLFRGAERAAAPLPADRPPVDRALAPTVADDLAAAPTPATLPWRLSGVAVSDDGDTVAVVSGGGDVFLVRATDTLPGGDVVEDVGPGHVTLRTASGVVTLRLP